MIGMYDVDEIIKREEQQRAEQELKPLTEKMDSMFLLEFRQQYWDVWVEFMTERGCKAELED